MRQQCTTPDRLLVKFIRYLHRDKQMRVPDFAKMCIIAQPDIDLHTFYVWIEECSGFAWHSLEESECKQLH